MAAILRFFKITGITRRCIRRCFRYFSNTSSHLPLSGIRVVDLTRVLAGPHCSQLLGDLGAEVIKIEHPEHGDETRSWGPSFTLKSSTSAYYLSLNRNKKSITVNIKSSKGQQILHKLISKSDILVENFVPDTLEQYNLDYQYLHDNVNKSLIYCSITAFGSTGPYKYRKGYDVVIQAMSGMLHITGTKSSPCKTGIAATDIITGLYAQNAILSAIISRNASTDKLGQKIDVNLFECAVASLSCVGSNYLIGGHEAKRWETGCANIVPYQGFKCLDDEFIVIAAGNDAQFDELCGVLKLEYLLNDKKFIHNKDRLDHRNALVNILKERFRMKRRDEWLNVFEGCGIPYAPINNMERVFEDKHLKERGLVKTVKHPVDGDLKIVGLPLYYSRDKDVNTIRMHPPMLGEHNKDIICDLLGFDQTYIDD
eukprot:831034_1